MFYRSYIIAGAVAVSLCAWTAQAERAPMPAQKTATKVFELDRAHSYLSFVASTLLFEVPGRFGHYDVKIVGDPDTLVNPQIRVDIDAASINTDNEKRDAHLRTKDFFSVAEFPKIIFTSNSLKKEGNKLMVKGTLEMHGVKKELTIPFDVITAPNGAGIVENVYRADFSINRKDYGIGTESIGAKISLKDQITIRLLLAGFFEDLKSTSK